MRQFIEDLTHAIRVAIDAWHYRRHLRSGGNPDIF